MAKGKPIDFLRAVVDQKVRGRVIARHTADRHFYEVAATGRLLPSVTQKNVLQSPHLLPWAARLAVEHVHANGLWPELDGPRGKEIMRTATTRHAAVRDDAGNVGTQAHDAIEAYVNEWIASGRRPDDIAPFLEPGADPRAVSGARAGAAFFDRYPATPIAAELLVGVDTPTFQAAGTLDLVVQTADGKLEIWDWKTSNRVSPFYAAQVAAYARAFELMTGLRVTGQLRVAKISKDDGSVKPYVVRDRKAALELYKSSARCYDLVYADGAPDLLPEDKVIVKL